MFVSQVGFRIFMFFSIYYKTTYLLFVEMAEAKSPAREKLPVNYQYEDEISLIDLWLILVRRKKALLIVFLVCVISGVVLALVKPPTYTYTTSIEIGTQVEKDNIRPIEDPQTLLAKIQESYIPLVIHEYFKSHPDEEKENFDVKARVPNGSQIIVLESKGPNSKAQTYLTLQQSVVDKVKQDHQRIVTILKKEVENERNKAISKLNELKDEGNLIAGREKRNHELDILLNSQIKQIEEHLAGSEKDRRRAVKEATNAAKAMTLLMLDSDIEKRREHLAELQERVKIEVADKRDEFVKALADNKRAQENQADHIARLEAQLQNLRETRALVPPMQSNKPTGLTRKVIAVISVVIGMIIALFAAFFAEFLAKANQQMRQQNKETGQAR